MIASATVAGTAADPLALEAVRDQAARTFERLVEDNSVTIDRSLFLDGAKPVQIPVTPETTVDELLDSIFLAIRPAVEPFTYTKSWVLANEGRALGEIGTLWARQSGKARDERALPQVGIVPGSKLLIVRPPFRTQQDA